jgi:hypothetical protein
MRRLGQDGGGPGGSWPRVADKTAIQGGDIGRSF